MVTNLQGRHVIVVGLGGMGLPLAQALMREGATVTACDRDANRINGSGLPGAVLDITNEHATDQTLRALANEHGQLWGVCVTAAIVGQPMDVLTTSSAEFRPLVEVNFFGTMHVNQVAARLMVDAGRGGRIINWSSVNAVGGTRGGGAYAPSKAAVETFSHCLALELAEHEITVNVIRPGSVDTPMISHLPDDIKDEDRARIPLGRWGTGDDIAHVTRMLLDPDAAWITGSVITVDGGMLASVGRPIQPRLTGGS